MMLSLQKAGVKFPTDAHNGARKAKGAAASILSPKLIIII
jgi:hypothetical protein